MTGDLRERAMSEAELRAKVSAAIKRAGDDCFGRGMKVSDACDILADAALSVIPAAQGWLQQIENEIAERSKRFRTFDDRDEHSRHMALALAGEVGELLNIVKKHWRGDTLSINGKALLDEASDIFVYWTLFCHVHGWPIELVIRHANEKAERKIIALRRAPSPEGGSVDKEEP